tara:strand:- start:319 stop:825 length:507 start_codon:yes stop_codon:yes gene_type:complete
MRIFFASSLIISIFTLSAENSIQDCSLIKEDLKRLECFDSFFSSSSNLTLIDSDSVIEIQNENTEKNNEEEIIDNRIDVTKQVNSKKIKLEASQEILDRFLKIRSIKKLGNNYSIKLNDGTIWKTNESIWNKDILKPEANVLIEPGAFGSKFIKFKGTKTKIRVKRIK